MSDYHKFEVTLIFGGEFCPMLPSKKFVVNAISPEGAVNVATYDAMNQGYKRGWIVGHEVELLG